MSRFGASDEGTLAVVAAGLQHAAMGVESLVAAAATLLLPAARPCTGSDPGAAAAPARSPSPAAVADPGLELATAALCVLDGERWRRATIPPNLVARLSEEYAVPATHAGECASPFAGKVVGWSTWGDPVELQLSDRCAMAGSPWTPDPVPWSLSSELADELAALPLGPPVEQR